MQNNELILRIAEEKDAEGIASIEKICFKDPWSKESILDEIVKNDLSTYTVAEYKGEIVGYIGMWNIADEGHITNIAVIPEYRCNKIADKMLDKAICDANEKNIKAFTLEVRKTNEIAQKFYIKKGFKNMGIRPKYYMDGEDAIIMWRMEEE